MYIGYIFKDLVVTAVGHSSKNPIMISFFHGENSVQPFSHHLSQTATQNYTFGLLV